jgi:hypothetical protein
MSDVLPSSVPVMEKVSALQPLWVGAAVGEVVGAVVCRAGALAINCKRRVGKFLSEI